MTKNDYAAQRRDPRWQRMRLAILSRDGFKCCICCGSDSTLHVHHLYYISGRFPWEYPPFALKTLCKECHLAGHDRAAMEQEWGEDGLFDPISEWEIEVNWILGGDSEEAGRLWDAAGLIDQASNVIGRGEVYRLIEQTLERIVKAPEAGKL